MKAIKKSPWVAHFNASSCNGCDLEILESTLSAYDIEQLGAINVGNPKHADILLVTGGVNKKTKFALEQVYSQMTEPRVVVAIGICACNGGVFKDGYSLYGGVDQVIPVDFYVPGCAAKPQTIAAALAQATELLAERSAAVKRGDRPMAQSVQPDSSLFWPPAGTSSNSDLKETATVAPATEDGSKTVPQPEAAEGDK